MKNKKSCLKITTKKFIENHLVKKKNVVSSLVIVILILSSFVGAISSVTSFSCHGENDVATLGYGAGQSGLPTLKVFEQSQEENDIKLNKFTVEHESTNDCPISFYELSNNILTPFNFEDTDNRKHSKNTDKPDTGQEMTSGGLSNLDIAALQKQGEIEGWTFTVGENSATNYSLDALCSLVEPKDWWIDAHFDPCMPLRDLPASFDWRALGGCTPVKHQGSCGSCWAFGTVGPLESAILINDGATVDLSEQWLVSCNSDGWDCGDGWWAHEYHQWKTDCCGGTGAVLEIDFPYVAYDAPCDCPYFHAYTIDSWAYIGDDNSVPDVSAIKQAIMDHGPVSAAVRTNSAFHSYTGGVFNDSCNHPINHGVVLVGWDDDQGTNGVWFLRNSWGAGWGESGYMCIEYGCSNVGYAACYIDYQSDTPDENATVCGYVNDSVNGLPIQNASVSVYLRDDQNHEYGNSTITDSSGFYNMNVAAGEIFLRAESVGYVWESTGWVGIEENQTVWFNFSLEADTTPPMISNLTIPDYVGIEHPGNISVNVTDSNLQQVGILLFDYYNTSFDSSFVIWYYLNDTGKNGTYAVREYTGIYAELEQGVNSTPITVMMLSNWSETDKIYTPANFKKNQTSPPTQVFLEFDLSDGILTNIAMLLMSQNGTIEIEYITDMIEPDVSIIESTVLIFDVGWVDQNCNYTLYSIGDSNNPHLEWYPLLDGDYAGWIFATDKASNSNFTMFNVTVSHSNYDISGTVFYNGTETGAINIALYDEYIGEGSEPIAWTSISSPGNYTFEVINGTYYLEAYVDLNGNGYCDGEPLGFAINATFGQQIDEIIVNGSNMDGIDITLHEIPDIVYVDDDFNSSTSGWQLDHFDNIQDGVDAVNECGTVYVYNGTYYEHVVIDKTINLIGENRNTSIIEYSSGEVIFVSANLVNISRLTIRYADIGAEIVSGIKILSQNNKISNCEIKETHFGIIFDSCHDNEVKNVRLNNISYGIKVLGESHNNIFVNSTILNNGYGIYKGSNLIIKGNIIHHCTVGIQIIGSDMLIINNSFCDNNIAISCESGSLENTISYNNFSSSESRLAIRMFDCYEYNINFNEFYNTGICIFGNRIVYYLHNVTSNIVNGKPLYYLINDTININGSDVGQLILIQCSGEVKNINVSNTYSGIILACSTNVTIKNSYISNNSCGICMDHSNNNSILENNISNNRDGCYLDFLNYNNTIFNNIFFNNYIGLSIDWYCSDNIITDNVFLSNTYRGLILYSSGNYIYHNIFINNPYNAHSSKKNIWDSGYPSGGNYFDDYTGIDDYNGPNQDIPGSDGIGDTPYSIPGDSNQDFYPLMNPLTSPPSFVWVDDDFNNTIPGWQYNQFDVIQDGIDAVCENGTVYVFNGTYFENVTIDKKINLVGEDTLTTIIESLIPVSTVIITADNVTMKNFSIGSSSYGDIGIRVLSCKNLQIGCCNIDSSGEAGIELESGCENVLIFNCSSNASSCGIYVYEVNDIVVANCNLSNNQLTGLWISDSYQIQVRDSMISLNDEYGIFLFNSSEFNVSGCVIGDNDWAGIRFNYSSNSTIQGCEVFGSTSGIYFDESSNNTIFDCFIRNNTQNIHLNNANYDNILRNLNIMNGQVGVQLYTSSTNELANCSVSNNEYGIFFGGFSLFPASNNVISGCNIFNNDYGVMIESSKNNNVFYNNYFNNTNNAIDNGTNIWNISKILGMNIIGGDWLGGNYWSDYTGVDTDGDGLGDTEIPYNSSGNIQNGGDWLPLVLPSGPNDPPVIFDENPVNGSTGINRPPSELNATVEDPDSDAMNVFIRWKKHDYYHFGEWTTLESYTDVGNGTYNFIPPYENDWIWGNTTYTWSVNVTDGTTWTNETYYYTTGGSRYDVNNNGVVNFQDAGLVWIHRTSEVDCDGIYDVNQNGVVNFQDAGLTWVNRD